MNKLIIAYDAQKIDLIQTVVLCLAYKVKNYCPETRIYNWKNSIKIYVYIFQLELDGGDGETFTYITVIEHIGLGHTYVCILLTNVYFIN